PDEDLGQVIHAIIQTDGEVSDAELLAHLRVRLAPYKLPRSFERVTEPLRDEAGKVRRPALRAARGGATPPGEGASAPINPRPMRAAVTARRPCWPSRPRRSKRSGGASTARSTTGSREYAR